MISVKPFEEKHVEEAAQLFAARYALLRQSNGLLPPKFSP